jgi:hypothetical protein
MLRPRMWLTGLAVVGVGLAISQYRTPVRGADPVKPAATKAPALDKAAVERTREQVKMLDDLYKTAVVKITQVYVGQQGEVPAAIAAMEIFHEMKKKGWHDARLIDASGKPKNKGNIATTDFEKQAVKAMKDGKTYYEEIGETDGKPVFRAATVVPAVMKECAVCHRVKEGTLLGTIVYELPIK